MRKNLELTKYLREKILDQRNIYKKQIWTFAIPKRKNTNLVNNSTMIRDPRDLR